MNENRRSVVKDFIVLEGIDGSGTTTQLGRIGEAAAARGVAAWTSFEPTNLPTGQFLRRVLSGEVPALPGTIARLFAADRHEHIFGAKGAFEHLGKGELVVFDRYFFSSLAYQGMDIGMDLPFELNAAFPLPELLLYFDIEVNTALTRLVQRQGRDIYETKETLKRVRATYEEAFRPFESSGMRFVRIDASLPLEEVSRIVDEELQPIFERKRSHS